MFDYLLFDLDGTLTDSKEGITKSVQYALRCFAIDEPDLDKLEPFIGPPLKNSFMEFYGFDDAKAQEAVGKYREYFNETGILQNAVYPGIPQMLKALKGKGKKLAVSSSKPAVYVERILEHFEIRGYFDVVVGSELDGSRSEKAEVVEEALRQLLGGRWPGHEAVAIIGDRKFDVEGGLAHDITTIAVSYGYGSMEELKEAKAEYIVRSVEELKKLLLRGTEDAKYEPPLHKISKLVFPMLMAYLVWQIGGYLGMVLTVILAQSVPAFGCLVEFDSVAQTASVTGIGIAFIDLVSFLVAGAVLFKMSRQIIRKAAQEAANLGDRKPAFYALAALAAAGLAVGANVLFELAGIGNKLVAYAQMQKLENTAPFWLAVPVYCVAAPVAEEFIFRGILYNQMKKYMNVRAALLFSALLFGLYQGNPVSTAYGFLLGLLIAFVYERSGKYLAALGVRMLANLCVYVLTYTGMLGGFALNWPVCVICLAAGAAGVWLLWRQDEKLYRRGAVS